MHSGRTGKMAVLRLLKGLGLFAVSRRLTRRRLRILCYHGISMCDEDGYNPTLFMRAPLFAARMRWLKDEGFTVIPLDEAVRGLSSGRLPDDAVVITFDDGWFGILEHAVPVLRRLGFPATVYVTTYYVGMRLPVFNVLVHYMFWRSAVDRIDLARLDRRLAGAFSLKAAHERERAADTVIGFARRTPGADARQDLLRALGAVLELDVEALLRLRICQLMTPEELAAAAGMGVDIQLHTHRHRLPLADREAVVREVEDNRRALAPVAAGDLVHLAYPSGLYHPSQWPWLQRLDIRSAATTRPGLNGQSSHPFELHRILDGQNIPVIEFEAEMSGALEILRFLRSAFSRRSRGKRVGSEPVDGPQAERVRSA